jgi:hypothetical protein
MAQPRPQTIDAGKDQRQQQRQKHDAYDCVSDAAVMLEKVPTISERQNYDVRIGCVSRENADETRAR